LNHPETEDNSFFSPSESFKMVMKGSNTKDFLFSKFLTRELEYNGESIPYKYKRDDEKNKHSIGKHCHNSEVCS
jgi:hypothetical protein